MANTLTAFNPTIWSRAGVAILREKIVMPRLVRTDFSPDIAQAGDTVNTRKPGKFTASDVSTTTGITVSDAAATNISIALNQHRHVAFRISDREQSYSIENLASRYLDPAMLGIANDVDSKLLALYADISSAITVSSAGDWKTKMNTARTKLNKNKVKMEQRYAVLSDDDEGAMAALDILSQVNTSGTDQTLRQGIVGRYKGFDVMRDSNVISVNSPAVRKNILFQRDAFAFVNRPLAVAAGIAPGVMQAVGIDPDAGLSIRLTMAYNYTLLATQVIVDILYGVKTLDEQCAVILNASF